MNEISSQVTNGTINPPKDIGIKGFVSDLSEGAGIRHSSKKKIKSRKHVYEQQAAYLDLGISQRYLMTPQWYCTHSGETANKGACT